jgi:DNA-directed RNA polymerase subunit RPC12/RpoP
MNSQIEYTCEACKDRFKIILRKPSACTASFLTAECPNCSSKFRIKAMKRGEGRVEINTFEWTPSAEGRKLMEARSVQSE